MTILQWNRSAKQGRPGGDTVIIDSLSSSLQKLGHTTFIGSWDTELMITDVIHINHLQFDWAKGFAESAIRINVPYVLTPFYLRDTNDFYANTDDQRFVIKNAKTVIVTGNREKDQIIEDLRLEDDEVNFVTIPNATRDIFYYDGLKSGNFVLAVGRVETRKNLIPVAKACKELHIPFVIAGTLPTKEWVTESLVRDELLSLGAILLGGVTEEQLVNLYHQAKIVSLTSLTETDSGVPYEAALSSCNLLLTTNTESANVLGRFSSVQIIHPEAEQQKYVNKLRKLIETKNDGSARVWVKENRTWDVVVPLYEKVYKDVCKK